MIRLAGITKHYSTRFVKTHVLRGIDLEIEEGEFVCIMGPSGSGKSTLLHILGMLDTSSSGEYYFEDQAVHKLSERKRTDLHKNHIGFVFQAYHLIDELTVYENLETPLLYKKVGGGDRKKQVSDILAQFHLAEKQKLFPHQLSGGEQQLVAVARAVIIEPKLILADEPTGNLQSAQGEEIMTLFAKLNAQGTTIVQATHSERNASYSGRILHLVDGRIEKDEIVSPG